MIDINTMTTDLFQNDAIIQNEKKGQSEHIAEKLLVHYLREEDYRDRSIFFISGMVFGKTGIKIEDSRVEELAKECRS